MISVIFRTFKSVFTNKKAQIVVVTIMFISISLLLYRTSQTTSAHITIGQRDTMWLRQFDTVDTSNDLTFRWSSAQSTIRIPFIYQGWNTTTLHGWGSASSQHNDVTGADVHATIATHAPVSFLVHANYRRHYTLLTPPPYVPSWYTPMTIASSTISDTVNSRYLGIALLSVHVQPTTLQTGLPYSLIIYWLILLGSGIVGWLLGASVLHSALASMTMTVSVVGLYITYTTELIPHLHWFAIWLGLCCGGLLVARITGITHHAYTVPGVALPLLSALVLWLMPLFQIVLRRDDIYIRNFRYESWMNITLLIIVVGGALLYWVQYRTRFIPITFLNYWYMLVGFVMLGIMYRQYDRWRLFKYGSSDFNVWINAARHWLDTGLLYDVPQIAGDVFGYVYKYPPFYVMLFMPFVNYDNMQLIQYFRIFNMMLVIIALVLWLRMLRAHPLWWFVVFIFTLNYQPLFDTLSYGQSDVLFLAGFTVILYAIHVGHDKFAGVLLAVLTLCKVYPVIFVVFFVIKRQWDVLIGFLIGLIACNAVSIAVIGWDIHVQYILSVLPIIGGTTSWIDNQTIAGFLARWYDNPFALNRFTLHSIEQIARIISYLLSALVCVITFRDTPARSSAYALQYSLFIVLMVVAVPVAWMHYATMLLLVFLIVFWHFYSRNITLRLASAFALSYALVAFGDFRSFNYPADLGIVTIIMSSYKFYGMLLLFIMLLYSTWHHTSGWSTTWLKDWHTFTRYGSTVLRREARRIMQHTHTPDTPSPDTHPKP